MTTKLHTEFAPAERMPIEIVRRQSAAMAGSPLAAAMMEATSDYVVILNQARQIVFHSSRLESLLAPGDFSNLLGMRPGEALGCAHANQCLAGCGTSEECSQCGAIHAIMEALEGRRSVQECRMMRLVKGKVESTDYLVTATPFTHGGERFCICAVADISAKKRLQSMERAFFCNLLDAAGGLETLMQLLRQEVPAHLQTDLQVAANAFREMVEQVQSYRDLAAAERGELQTSATVEDAGDLLAAVVGNFRRDDLATGLEIALARPHQRLELATDKALLQRVLGQLLLNAIEASPAGSKVTAGCDRIGDRVRFWIHNAGFMARDVQLSVFHRSFSTKGNGRGLGTYSTRLFTERYLGGKVDFHTSPVEGTTFLIEVPAQGLQQPPA